MLDIRSRLCRLIRLRLKVGRTEKETECVLLVPDDEMRSLLKKQNERSKKRKQAESGQTSGSKIHFLKLINGSSFNLNFDYYLFFLFFFVFFLLFALIRLKLPHARESKELIRFKS